MEQIAPEVEELIVGGDPERDSDAMVVMAAEGGGGEPDMDSAEEELRGNTFYAHKSIRPLLHLDVLKPDVNVAALRRPVSETSTLETELLVLVWVGIAVGIFLTIRRLLGIVVTGRKGGSGASSDIWNELFRILFKMCIVHLEKGLLRLLLLLQVHKLVVDLRLLLLGAVGMDAAAAAAAADAAAARGEFPEQELGHFLGRVRVGDVQQLVQLHFSLKLDS